MSRGLDFDPFIHPPLQAEQRERLRAEGAMGPAERELTFGQILDVINPLQHIPVVGTLYRAVTGDTLDSSASVVGSVIYGGPVGLVASMVGAVVEEASGRDIGGLALAALRGEEIGAPAAVAETAAATAAGTGAAAQTATPQTASPQTASAETGGAPAASASPAVEPARPDARQEPTRASAPPPPPDQALEESAALRGGRVLEGDDALAALAADLRAAVAGRAGAAPPAAADQSPARPVASAALLAARANAADTAGARIPPPESFMALSPRDFGGSELATRMTARHAADAGPVSAAEKRRAGLYPTALSTATKTSADVVTEAETGRPAGSIGTGAAADQRFAGSIAPQASFTERMMEALNKYQALGGQGGTAAD